MREVNYKVGNEVFKTYADAQKKGKIKKVILTDMNLSSDKYKQERKKQAEKIWNKVQKGEF